MPNFLIAAAALILGLITLRALTRAKPATIARYVRQAGAATAFSLAMGLLLRGAVAPALGLAGVAIWLSGLFDRFIAAARRGSGPKPGLKTTVRTAMIEMTLDHDSGAMAGSVLAGPFEGRGLDGLTFGELASIHAFCATSDPQGARLLEAYLDRRFAGWRETGQGDAGAGSGAQGGRARGRQSMSEQEAYEVLGLEPGSGRDAIVARHRSLMKRWHPDHGGSAELAARANEAKDVLLKRHR